MKFEAKKYLRVPVAAALLAAAGFAVPTITLAGPPVARVQVSDLNLATKGGQRSLERRTASAIDRVCPERGSAAGPRSRGSAAHHECAQSVRSSVQQQLRDRGAHPVAGRG